MRRFIVAVLIIIPIKMYCQSDSATVTFRTYQPSLPTVFVPGEFNNWGPNSNGNISLGAPSQMSYDSTFGAWLKTYTFKLKDPTDIRRRLGDSVFQYKFNRGGVSAGWYSDPLNPQQNPLEFNNSIFRLTKLFWFQVSTQETSQLISRITAGLVHTDADSITSIQLSTGPSATLITSTIQVISAYNVSARILDYYFPSPIARGYYLHLVAQNNHGDSVVYSKGGYAIFEMPLPSYAHHGVTLPNTASNDSTTFRIRIPSRQYVLLRIASAGEPVADATPIVMRYAETSPDWWINVKLPSGGYEYLYELDDGRQIYDPWGRVNGDYGSRFSTSEEGLTADNYIWQNMDYQRPPLNKLVIYELHIGEFVGGYYNLPAGQGKFTHLISLLPYFDSLGINALELMPINDFGVLGSSGFSWGYDVNSIFALEPSYGTPADFKTLVDSAHGRGIAVLADVVFNHINETSSLWQMLQDEAANPYIKSCNDLRYNEDELCFFKDLDHWTIETQELIYSTLKMWLDVYKVDGFRYDYTQGIGWNINDTTKGILGWSNRIHQEYGGTVYQIVEHLPESPALLYYSKIRSGWHDSFRDEIFDEARFRNTSLSEFENLVIDLGAYPGNDTPSSPGRYANRTEPVNMNVNHDEQSLIYEMTTFQSVPLDEALKRDKLYATLMFTSLGIPMLWQGMEFSAPRGWLNDNQRLSYRPVEWNYYSTDRGQSHYRYYQRLIQHRIHNPALTDGVLRKLKRYETEKVLVWGFIDSTTDARVMVIVNFSGSDRAIDNVPWLGTGVWYDIFDQNLMTVADSVINNFAVAQYTAKVYSNKSNADLGITLVEHQFTEKPPAFILSQNYPNPFNPTTTIGFRLRVSGFTSLKVYDVLGREVATLVNEEMSPGEYTVTWDASNKPSGVYYYQLFTGGFVETKKLILLR
ncbi:MAG TPA: alpha-amylase family glycosyl hydrolase [Bacteroidota bacterium]|nr:alpha-amylase family glycosyl hydrolase [Bacteroidota bacterium]